MARHKYSIYLCLDYSYEIPKDMIEKVFSVKAEKTSGSQNPSIVLWTNIDPRFLNPDTSNIEHRIYTLTSFKGDAEIYQNILDIAGPKYPKDSRIMGYSP
ncbi:MAG: hypothetical protein ABIG84_02780 [archaeon]